MTEARIPCPRCGQDWLMEVHLVHLNQDAVLCPECDALWLSANDLTSGFVDYETYMKERGRPMPYAEGELEIRGPLMMKAPADGSLLKGFLSEECDVRIRESLLVAIARPLPLVDEIAFNRWDVVVDKRDRSVTIVDVLDGSPAGKQRMSVEDFVAALTAKGA